MRPVHLILAALLLGCGHPQGAAAPEPTMPMTAEQLRAAWVPLAREEAALISDLTLLPALSPEEKTRRLTRMRQSAGFVAAGVGRLRPPELLAPCQRTAKDGAVQTLAALDRVNDVWMHRASGGRRAAEQLAADLCDALRTLAAAREACGVTEPVPVSSACAN